MGIKNAFKKIWLGIKIAEPYLSMAGRLLPPPFGTILVALDELLNRAEILFPKDGSGPQKAEYFTEQGLKVMEILTGKNVDNPTTRNLAGRLATVSVQIKDFTAEYHEIVKELKAAIESVKEPAKVDAP